VPAVTGNRGPRWIAAAVAHAGSAAVVLCAAPVVGGRAGTRYLRM